MHATRGHLGREPRVLHRRADRDAVIVPRDHVVPVHLLHDRPACGVALGNEQVRDLSARRADRQLHAQLRAEAARPRAARDHHRIGIHEHTVDDDTRASAGTGAGTRTGFGPGRAAATGTLHLVDRGLPHLDTQLLRGARQYRAHLPAVDPRCPRMVQRPNDRPEHRHHVARLVGADLGRAGRVLRHPLPRRQVRVARRELQDSAARPAVVGIELGQQLVVVPARRADEVDPRGVVALRGLRRQDPGARVGRAPHVGAVDEQRARTGPAQLERGRRAHDPASDDHNSERTQDSLHRNAPGVPSFRTRPHPTPRRRAAGSRYGSGLILSRELVGICRQGSLEVEVR